MCLYTYLYTHVWIYIFLYLFIYICKYIFQKIYTVYLRIYFKKKQKNMSLFSQLPLQASMTSLILVFSLFLGASFLWQRGEGLSVSSRVYSSLHSNMHILRSATLCRINSPTHHSCVYCYFCMQPYSTRQDTLLKSLVGSLLPDAPQTGARVALCAASCLSRQTERLALLCRRRVQCTSASWPGQGPVPHRPTPPPTVLSAAGWERLLCPLSQPPEIARLLSAP